MRHPPQDALLERLARLDASDRTWLLGELPPALRRELIEMLSDEDGAAAAPFPPAQGPASAGWESLSPEHVAQALGREPVWLVSAATRTAEGRWRERLLHTMSARRRQEVEYADRSGRPLAARASRALLEGVRSRIENGSPRAVPRSKFAALVDQMKERFA